MILAAAIQMKATLYDRAGNLARSARLIEEAAAAGARLIVLPEMIASGYGLEEAALRSVAEPLHGPTFETWAGLAAHHQVWIVGGYCEVNDDGLLYNAAMLVGPDGLIGAYRKLHLFDREKLVFTPGDLGLNVFETPIGRIGLCVCYDLRFVEVVRVLALRGADMIAVPTAWVGGFDRKLTDEMGYIGQARGAIVQANLNQVYLICASQHGELDNLRLLGSSLIADPYGEVLAGPLDDRTERIILAPVDPAVARRAEIRSDLVKPRLDRRRDIYKLLSAGEML